uniref:Uncharacterized protein n=1 Tax=Eptatretus burgeri TaxID=7764 RepID=A0A8C4QK73_EPTBU
MFQRRQRKMKIHQQSEQLEELQPQNETLMQDHKTTSGAVFLTEQDVEPNGNHHQEQHNVVQQGQLLRRNQNEEEARDKDDCLQQNATEDTKWHNKKIVAKRGLVDWLKRRQHRITVEIQQAKDFKKLSSYIVELKRQLKQGLQASEDKCELSENLMRMIEPAGKQFCLTLQQMDILSISRASQHSKCDLVTHLRVKKQESYGAQEPRRMIEAAELETTNAPPP